MFFFFFSLAGRNFLRKIAVLRGALFSELMVDMVAAGVIMHRFYDSRIVLKKLWGVLYCRVVMILLSAY